MKVVYLFVTFCCLCNLLCIAQPDGPWQAVKERRELPPTDHDLFNGYEYVDYDQRVYGKEHPYYRDRTLTPGTVWYCGRVYRHVPLNYDIVKDLVITRYKNNINRICLLAEKVDSFMIYGRMFIRMQAPLATGYYARLYKGRSALFGRYSKIFSSLVVIDNAAWDAIAPAHTFYLQVNGRFHAVKNKQALLQLLRDRKKELKRFIRREAVSFKADPEAALISVITYYDTLG